jgi:hypothetical protein
LEENFSIEAVTKVLDDARLGLLRVSSSGCNPEGCEKVAGGRSEAKTTVEEAGMTDPDGVSDERSTQEIFFEILAPLRGAVPF